MVVWFFMDNGDYFLFLMKLFNNKGYVLNNLILINNIFSHMTTISIVYMDILYICIYIYIYIYICIYNEQFQPRF